MKLVCGIDTIKVLINGVEVASTTDFHDGTYNDGVPLIAPQFQEYMLVPIEVPGGERFNYFSVLDFKWAYGNECLKIVVPCCKNFDISV